MKAYVGLLLGTAMIIGMSSSSAVAQTAEPTYKGDPSVYKLIFEDANFRVIEANHIRAPRTMTILSLDLPPLWRDARFHC